MYQSPASHCLAFSGVKVASPLIAFGVAWSFLLSQITTGPFWPSGPLWKCAIVTGPVMPLSVMSQVTRRVLGSHIRTAVPLLTLVRGGTCSVPESSTLKVIGAAVAIPTQAIHVSGVSATIARQNNAVVIVAPFSHKFYLGVSVIGDGSVFCNKGSSSAP